MMSHSSSPISSYVLDPLDLSLPMRSRTLQQSADEDDCHDGTKPSYKKSLIRRYCKCDMYFFCG